METSAIANITNSIMVRSLIIESENNEGKMMAASKAMINNGKSRAKKASNSCAVSSSEMNDGTAM